MNFLVEGEIPNPFFPYWTPMLTLQTLAAGTVTLIKGHLMSLGIIRYAIPPLPVCIEVTLLQKDWIWSISALILNAGDRRKAQRLPCLL